ncbi:MAG: ROK family protein, partial [Verrucomicrobiales bacterium]
GVLKVAPNLGWRDVPVRKVLSKAFDCPVAVLNDVDAGTYGEYKFGAGKGSTSLLGVFPGTGLGGGFIYRGQILHGKRYSCMELGDLRIGGSSLLRAGEEWPTLEDLTSRLAISSAITVEAYRGKVPSMVDLPISMIKSKMIAKSIETGEQAVTDILDKAIYLLGTGLAGVVSLLGPDVIVLGGGLVEKFPDRYVDGLQARLKELVTPDVLADLKICPAKLGDDAGAKGAAAYAGVES